MNATLLALIINGMRLCGSDYEAALERSHTINLTVNTNTTTLRNSVAADDAQYAECVSVVNSSVTAYKLTGARKVEMLAIVSLLVASEQTVARRIAAAKADINAMTWWGR